MSSQLSSSSGCSSDFDQIAPKYVVYFISWTQKWHRNGAEIHQKENHNNIFFHCCMRQWVVSTSLWKLSVWENCWQWFVSHPSGPCSVSAPSLSLLWLCLGPSSVSESVSSAQGAAGHCSPCSAPRQHLVPCHAVSLKHHNIITWPSSEKLLCPGTVFSKSLLTSFPSW